MNERFEWKSFVGRNLSRKEMLTPAKIGVDNTKCIYVPQPPHLSQKKTFYELFMNIVVRSAVAPVEFDKQIENPQTDKQREHPLTVEICFISVNRRRKIAIFSSNRSSLNHCVPPKSSISRRLDLYSKRKWIGEHGYARPAYDITNPIQTVQTTCLDPNFLDAEAEKMQSYRMCGRRGSRCKKRVTGFASSADLSSSPMHPLQRRYSS